MDIKSEASRPPKYVLAIIALFLILQVGIPIVQAGQSGSHRWGWQMYSRFPALGEYSVVLQDGSLREIDAREHLAFWRFELTPNDELLSQLCERESDAVSIRVHQDGSGTFEEFQCNDG